MTTTEARRAFPAQDSRKPDLRDTVFELKTLIGQLEHALAVWNGKTSIGALDLRVLRAALRELQDK